MKQLIQAIKQECITAITQPRAQLTRGQRTLRYGIDLAKHARRELRNHSAPTMAAALTYRTIFGLIPLLVMALIVFRAFGGFATTQQGITDTVYNLLEIQIDAVETASALREESVPRGQAKDAPENEAADGEPSDPTPAPDLSPAVSDNAKASNAPADAEPNRDQAEPGHTTDADNGPNTRQITNQEMKQRIDAFINDLAGRASQINIGSIGVVGTVILIWAALGLIVTVERNFNVIYNAPSGRPWHIRIPIYWAVITLGPVLIWASFYLSTQFLDASRSVPGVDWLIGIVNRFIALLATWLLIFILFKLMPNTRVAVRPAMIGAFVSAVCWEGMKAGLRWYIENAVITPTQSALYGSLALIPLLLFWVYLTWLVILAGLEIAHLIQTLPANRMGQVEPTSTLNTGDPWLVIPILAAVAEAFAQGKTVTADDLADRLNLPIQAIDGIARALARKGLLHHLDQEDGHPKLLLAQPAENIRIHDVIDASHTDLAQDAPGYALLQQIAEAQRNALKNARLGGHDGA